MRAERDIKRERPKIVLQSKSQPDLSILPRPIEQEIENLKRLLANISQRLDALKTR